MNCGNNDTQGYECWFCLERALTGPFPNPFGCLKPHNNGFAVLCDECRVHNLDKCGICRSPTMHPKPKKTVTRRRTEVQQLNSPVRSIRTRVRMTVQNIRANIRRRSSRRWT